MARQIAAWLSSDGSLHEKEDSAKTRDFEIAFDAWVENRFHPVVSTQDDARMSRSFENLRGAIHEDRMKLLAIWKLLNGGAAITAPPRDTPDNPTQ